MLKCQLLLPLLLHVYWNKCINWPQKLNAIKPIQMVIVSCCYCIFCGVCLLDGCFFLAHKRAHILCTFFCDQVCWPCSPPSLIQWFSGKFPDCCCAGLENIEAVTKAPAVSFIILYAFPCTDSPSKERWLLGTPLGAGLGDGKWAWKEEQTHLYKPGL